jgi:hypothetical protein
VKEVAGVDHRVDVALDGVCGHLSERFQEVLPSLRPVVLLVPQMRVPGVEYAGHCPEIGWHPLSALVVPGESGIAHLDSRCPGPAAPFYSIVSE